MTAQSEMREIDRTILSCKLCKLFRGRTNAVPGFGQIGNVEVVIIGEAPGRNEDLEGRPFVGSGGKLLDEVLQNAGLARDEVYITNVVKCRPPNNRKPESDEISICTKNYLEKQIAILKPLLVVTLGATALEYFTGKNKMGESHGQLTKTSSGIPMLPTYHPAAVFRTPSYRDLLQEDLKQIPDILVLLKQRKEKQTDLASFL